MTLSLLKTDTLLWIGEQKRPLLKNRKNDFVMDSIINYYSEEEPSLNYRAGRLFLDNGAFTARMNNIELDIQKVITLQEGFKPDLTIPLDYPFQPGTPEHEMKRSWNRTADNIIYWQNSTNLNGKLVPTLHAWDKQSLNENIDWLQKKADSDFIGLGSIVNENFSNFKGVFGDRQPTRQLIDMFSYAIENVSKRTDFKIHLMGWGSSPIMLHLGYYLGLHSLDSSGHRRKAAYGKIILPGQGERHLGVTASKFSSNLNDSKDKKNLLKLLDNCTCPICMTNKYALWSDWKARAIHNEYVMKQEAKTAEFFIQSGMDTYEKYLDNVVYANSGLRHIWEYAKKKKKYGNISEELFR